MNNSLADILPPNPQYGRGLYRRRILIELQDGKARCQLEDDCHGFSVEVRHDQQYILGIDATTLRAPVDVCFGAKEAIQQLTGLPIAAGRSQLAEASDPRRNCTHIYDLVLLALSQIQRGSPRRQVDVEVRDEQNGRLDSRLMVDDELIHHWQVRDDLIELPGELAGLPVLSGVRRWGSDHFDADRAEAAEMLCRGLLVAGTRRWDLASQEGVASDKFGPGTGVCYTYSPERISSGRRVPDSIRDFSDAPEKLLRFL